MLKRSAGVKQKVTVDSFSVKVGNASVTCSSQGVVYCSLLSYSFCRHLMCVCHGKSTTEIVTTSD